MDPELVFRSIGFTNFLSTWLIRRVDPKGLHPATPVECVLDFLFERISLLNVVIFGRLPLPKEVPMDFRVLPEYIVEDIVEYLFFAVQYVLSRSFFVSALLKCCTTYRTSPEKFELAGKVELMTFVLTFLTSTWYIKNPFLKSKINDVRTVFPKLIDPFFES